jgi:ribA/ribD-fused uncharacterized protein
MPAFTADLLHLSKEGKERLACAIIRTAYFDLYGLFEYLKRQRNPSIPANGTAPLVLPNLPYQFRYTLKGDTFYFKGEQSLLSNFSPCKIHAFGKTFPCTENAYHFLKALHSNNLEAINISLHQASGRMTKRMTRNLWYPNNVQWKRIRKDAMTYIIILKFQQDITFRNFLLGNKHLKIVEDTNDSYWGRGKDNKGDNILGNIIMEVRDMNHNYMKLIELKQVSVAILQGKIPEIRL